MSDVVELIQADHRRMIRLFASLERAASLEPGGYPHTAGAVWDRLAEFLSLHADAEQEICFLTMFRCREHRASETQEATADLNDLRETIDEASLHHCGCPVWWQAVRAARRAAAAHCRFIERTGLVALRQGAPKLLEELGRQWAGFISARLLAACAASGPGTANGHRPRLLCRGEHAVWSPGPPGGCHLVPGLPAQGPAAGCSAALPPGHRRGPARACTMITELGRLLDDEYPTPSEPAGTRPYAGPVDGTPGPCALAAVAGKSQAARLTVRQRFRTETRRNEQEPRAGIGMKTATHHDKRDINGKDAIVRKALTMSLPRTRLLKKVEVAERTMSFYFEKPAGFTYKAGQFADYTLLDPPETDAEGNIRGFSLASASFEPNLMATTRLRDTAFKRVLRELPPGSELELDAPYGSFALHNKEARPAVFLTGGIGITPVRSIVLQSAHDKTKHTILVFCGGWLVQIGVEQFSQ